MSLWPENPSRGAVPGISWSVSRFTSVSNSARCGLLLLASVRRLAAFLGSEKTVLKKLS